ncbi:MAG: hypothetical protein AAF745_02610 [Planctomycetota bacterium]
MSPSLNWDGNDNRSPYDEERLRAMGSIAADGLEMPSTGFRGNQGRMFRSVQKSYRALEPYREMTQKLVEDYAGTYYGNETTSETRANRYVNLLNQAVEAYQMLLAANRPRVMISTNLTQYRAFAKHFQYAINALIKEIHLEDTMAQWVMDAFFCVGIVKTHLANSGVVELETDLWMDPGRPFASNISLDNFVYDMRANKWSEVRYAGDMYEMSWDDATDLFGEDALMEHVPRNRRALDVERVDSLSKSVESDSDDFEDMIDLADIWVPRHGVIYTYVVQSRRDFILAGSKPVAIEPWTGDEDGPYHLLGFGDVPENIMHASPASHLEMLDALVNDLFRKSARQARRQKEVNLYTAGGAKASQQVQMADDGEWVNVNDTSDIKSMDQGGVNQGNYAFLVGSIETFDRMAGNLRAQLGLGQQAETLGQEKLVHGAASQKVDKMSKTVVSAVTRLIKALGMMLWQDDVKQIVSEIPIQGARGISVTSVWKPGDREGNFIDYNFDIDVYSMQYQSPSGKLAQLSEVVQNVFIPLSPMLAQQGGAIDMFALTNQYADLMNLPELRDVVRFVGVTGDSVSPSAMTEVPRKPPNSTRNYVRTNVSANSQTPMAQSVQMMGQAASLSGPQTPGGAT